METEEQEKRILVKMADFYIHHEGYHVSIRNWNWEQKETMRNNRKVSINMLNISMLLGATWRFAEIDIH